MRVIGRLLSWILGAIAAVLVVWAFADVAVRVATGGPEAGKIQLRILFWGDNRERQIVLDLVDAFEAQNPGVDVLPIHATDYDSKLLTMLASGDPPDAFYVPYERMLGRLVEDGQLAALTEYIEREGGEAGPWFSDFYPELVDAFRWDTERQRTGSGPVYGLPKDFTTTVKYVNVDLFEAAGVALPTDGWTWSEYTDAVRRIDALNATGDFADEVHGGVMLTWSWVLRNHVWTFGGDYFGDGFDDVTLDEPAAVEALEFIVERRREGSVYSATGIAQSEDELFRLGRVGVIGPLGRWRVPTYREVDFRWDVVPLPVKAGVDPASAIATVSWSMSSQTEHPEETWSLIKFLCAEPGQRLTAELGLAIPALKSVAESDAFLQPGMAPEHAPLFLESLEHARLLQSPNEQEFQQYVDQELQNQALSLNQQTPMEAGERIEERWLTLLGSPLRSGDLPPMPWRSVVITAVIAVAAGIGAVWFFARRQQLGNLDRAEERTGWLFVLPWVVGFCVFLLGPMVLSLLLAFSKWSATGPLSNAEFAGLGNFIQIARDDEFAQAIKVTAYYTVIAVPLTQVLAIAVALLMNLGLRWIGLFRTAYFVPSVVSGVALVVLWITIFDNSTGILNISIDWVLDGTINRLLSEDRHISAPDWFGLDAKWWASPALVIMASWGVGGAMVIYLAGLKNVPASLYEAACLDGAGPVRRFWNVTVPMISPIIFFQFVMAIIASFQIFTQAFVIRGSTGGTNQDLLFYVLYLYDHAFRNHNMGYASALAWILFVVILLLTLLVFGGSKRFVHYEGLK
ncbi:MAG: extracellular solute-binding protein [Planctomycetota bacterium]